MISLSSCCFKKKLFIVTRFCRSWISARNTLFFKKLPAHLTYSILTDPNGPQISVSHNCFYGWSDYDLGFNLFHGLCRKNPQCSRCIYGLMHGAVRLLFQHYTCCDNMVVAGVYLVARLFPLHCQRRLLLYIVGYVGAFTSLLQLVMHSDWHKKNISWQFQQSSGWCLRLVSGIRGGKRSWLHGLDVSFCLIMYNVQNFNLSLRRFDNSCSS